MNLADLRDSLLRYFKKDRDSATALEEPPEPILPLEKPASERLGKTVVPNVSRMVVAPDAAINFPLAPPAADGNVAVPIGFAASPATAVMSAAAPRKVSLGVGGQINARLNPAVDETAILIKERKIALPLSELLSGIPADLLSSAPIDPERRVLFPAAEVERGMSSGKPAASLRSLYQQAPELFTREVAEDDPAQVPLPLGKVLEQFSSFHVRPDQILDDNLPQLETPFLQVAIEDGSKFGTSTGPLPKPEPPPVAGMIVADDGSADRASIAAPFLPGIASGGTTAASPAARPTAPIRLPVPPSPEASAAAKPASFSVQPSLQPPGAFNFSPNGTGASATERVPASSGPPVPTPFAPPSAPPPPTRIAFNAPAPANQPEAMPKPRNDPIRLQAVGPVPGEIQRRIRLSLREVVRGIPPFQISGPGINEVPEDAQLEFAAALIEAQLAHGRIEVSPDEFEAALPAEFRNRFKIEDPAVRIQLPLQQVLENLSPESLHTRRDQEHIEVKTLFETPFSQKAAEDAERLKGVATSAVAPAEVLPRPTQSADLPPAAAVPATEAAAPQLSLTPSTTSPAKTASAPARIPLPKGSGMGVGVDPKSVVARASGLPGVEACAIVFADGLSLAGNIPADYDLDGLCAIAPVMMKRLDAQMTATNLGTLHGITLLCAKTPVTFFTSGSICLAALHARREHLPAETQAQLARVTGELAETYTSNA